MPCKNWISYSGLGIHGRTIGTNAQEQRFTSHVTSIFHSSSLHTTRIEWASQVCEHKPLTLQHLWPLLLLPPPSLCCHLFSLLLLLDRRANTREGKRRRQGNKYPAKNTIIGKTILYLRGGGGKVLRVMSRYSRSVREEKEYLRWPTNEIAWYRNEEHTHSYASRMDVKSRYSFSRLIQEQHGKAGRLSLLG